jgi:hypothetical protein
MATTPTELVEITVETVRGARCVFPDMPRDALEWVIESYTKGICLTPQLELINVSGVLLSLPLHVVSSISFDGEVKWTNAAAMRELPETDHF